MIVLAKEINIGDSKYVVAYLKDGKELKQQGELHGYTDTTFAVNRNGRIFVYDTNNEEVVINSQGNRSAKEDLEIILEVNK